MPTNQITTNIIEEVELNQPTGVEAEIEEDEGIDLEKPWDPKLIRVDPKNFSLRNILDMIDEDELELAPDFQRKKVWNTTQKARLIESVLLRIPLPAFYFSSDEEGALQVVDGLQRLSTIHDFVRGGSHKKNFFPLNKLEYLQKEVGGKKFEGIGNIWQRRIFNTQITVHVVDPQTPDKVKFDIFKRINTGGSPLNSQEIRHCMSRTISRKFLKQLANNPLFNKATHNKLQEHIRMVDREVILRFCAFRLLERIEDYSGTMDGFLTEATRKLDEELNEDQLEELAVDFERAMENALNLFGEYAFRKWPSNSNKILPINRALFEVWSVILAGYEWEKIKPHTEKIVEIAQNLILMDEEFISSITSGTSSTKRVLTRFNKVQEIFQQVGL